MATIDKVKMSLRVKTNAFDEQLTDLISAALADLGIAGIKGEQVAETDPLVLRAVTTYCQAFFGAPEEYDQLLASYERQKGQLYSATGYTLWGTEGA